MAGEFPPTAPPPAMLPSAHQGELPDASGSHSHSHSHNHSHSHSLSSRKRQKINLACEECRSRKVRCDGVRPRCGACKKRYGTQLPCEYLSPPIEAAYERKLIKSLQNRIADIESQLGQHGGPDPLPLDDAASKMSDEDAPEALRSRQPTPESPACSAPPGGAMRQGDVSASVADMDGLAMETTSPSASKVHDMASATASLCGTQRLPTDSGVSFAPGAAAAQHVEPMGAVEERFALDINDYHLPPRHLADELMDIYWQRVHCIYPYLHWPTFVDAYHRVWDPDPSRRRSIPPSGVGLGGPDCSVSLFYCALNVVFALATQFSSKSSTVRKELLLSFSHRARHLLQLDCLDDGNMALVQALLLMAHYTQGTSVASRCWNVVGLAYRMAEGLQLHVETGDGAISPGHRDMRRRLWHGCVSLDIVVGLMLGRPRFSSPQSNVPLPDVTDQGAALYSTTSTAAFTTQFLAESIKLAKLLAKIVTASYNPCERLPRPDSHGSDGAGEYTDQMSLVLHMEKELDQLERDMPDIFHWSSQPPDLHENDILRRQRHVLRARYLHTRLLLYRPMLVGLLQRHEAQTTATPRQSIPGRKHATEHHLYQAVAERCSLASVKYARALIRHVHLLSTTFDTDAPWFNAYYAYHAAMVLTMAETLPPIRSQLDPGHLQQSWGECGEIVTKMLILDPEMYAFLSTLHSIAQCVSQVSTDQDPPGQASCGGQFPEDLPDDVQEMRSRLSNLSWVDRLSQLDPFPFASDSRGRGPGALGLGWGESAVNFARGIE